MFFFLACVNDGDRTRGGRGKTTGFAKLPPGLIALCVRIEYRTRDIKVRSFPSFFSVSKTALPREKNVLWFFPLSLLKGRGCRIGPKFCMLRVEYFRFARAFQHATCKIYKKRGASSAKGTMVFWQLERVCPLGQTSQ